MNISDFSATNSNLLSESAFTLCALNMQEMHQRLSCGLSECCRLFFARLNMCYQMYLSLELMDGPQIFDGDDEGTKRSAARNSLGESRVAQKFEQYLESVQLSMQEEQKRGHNASVEGFLSRLRL